MDKFVKDQFRLNNGRKLRMKWVEEKDSEGLADVENETTSTVYITNSAIGQSITSSVEMNVNRSH